jgi:hypothetical protein
MQVMQAEDPPAGGDEVPLQRDHAICSSCTI